MRTVKMALAAFTMLLASLAGVTVTAAPAHAAGCNAQGVCSTIKNADNSNTTMTVYCQHNGYTGTIVLQPGQQAGCGLYAYQWEIYFGRTAYCKPLGSSQPFTYYGGSNTYWIPGVDRMNCLIIR